MESFTVHIQHQLHDILGELEPIVNVALTQERLEKLFNELAFVMDVSKNEPHSNSAVF
jgi:hypothetical protein